MQTSLFSRKVLVLSALLVFFCPACSSDDAEAETAVLDRSEFVFQLAQAYCEYAQPCCEEKLHPVNLRCEESYREFYNESHPPLGDTDSVFHGEIAANCVAAIKSLENQCDPSVEQNVKAGDLCESVFEGQLDPGEECRYNSQCAHDENSKGYCLEQTDTRQCVIAINTKEGDTCDTVVSSDWQIHVCVAPAFCSLPTTVSTTGVCKVAAQVGDDCAEQACAVGTYCDFSTVKCTEGRGSGETCDGSYQCKSLSCTENKCTAPVGSGEHLGDSSIICSIPDSL